MSLITTTPLLNDPPSSFSCENNNNIVWILSRLEKRIDQIETSRNQRTFVKDNLSQNNALMALIKKNIFSVTTQLFVPDELKE
ncbi:12058_t:CDS:2, partial [Entrophospora sp. SA101]